jgi:hypothetical protein
MTLNRGYAVAADLRWEVSTSSRWLLGEAHYFNFFLCGVIGGSHPAFVYIAIYTEYRYRPVQSIAELPKPRRRTSLRASPLVESTGYRFSSSTLRS